MSYSKAMNPFHRLQALRMENDAAAFRQEEMRGRFQAYKTRHEDGTAPRAVSAFNLFQTPPELAERLVSMLELHRNKRVLEPSAGLGRLLDAIGRAGAWDVTAVESAKECAAELYRQERPEMKLLQRDFLTIQPEETGLFDAVAMNPPFHMRADIRHIMHARKFLKPGGIIAALCMDTHHREDALRPIASTWEKIPAGAFKGEGTMIASVLLTIRAA